MKRRGEQTIPVAEARRVIRDCRIRYADEIDVDLIAARYDLLVEEKPLAGAEGRLVRKGQSGVISVQSSINESGRKRFVAAHELGHFFLHPETRQLALCTAADMNRWSSRHQDEETEANAFAAELLMPHSIFQPCVEGKVPSMDLIMQLAEDFRTTLTATAIQYVKNTSEPCALVASTNGKRNWVIPSESFAEDFFIKEGEGIHEYSCAAELVERGANHVRATDVPAGAWLEHYDPSCRECLTEDSMMLGRYRMVLSLLWIEQAI
jgi:hypothetical protein